MGAEHLQAGTEAEATTGGKKGAFKFFGHKPGSLTILYVG